MTKAADLAANPNPVRQFVDLSNGLTAWHDSANGLNFAVKLDEPGDKIGPRVVLWTDDYDLAVETTRENEKASAVLVVMNPQALDQVK
jgi:hypothetical protein